MASEAYKELEKHNTAGSEMPRHKQLIQMLSFRVVPAYYKEIEKVANHKKVTVSKLIRAYIKDGMKRDKEITNQEGNEFRIE